MIKFGILGYGRIVKKTMIPALKSSKFAELEMIGSRTKTGEGFCTYEEVLSNKNIDVVYIALPIGLHKEWTIKAANAGKHILVEKSSTISYESAKKMIKICKKNNVRLMEAFMFKYHPQHQKVLDMISNEEIGKVINFYGLYGSPFYDKKDIRLSKELGGGALNDMGCYPINASRMIFKEEPESVSCRLTTNKEKEVADIKSDITLLYSEGKSAFCSACFGASYKVNYSLWGTKTYIDVPRAYAVSSDMQTQIIKGIDDNKVETIRLKAVNQTTKMVDYFCKVINGILPSEDFEKELLLQAKVMEAARRSNREKRRVMLNEIK